MSRAHSSPTSPSPRGVGFARCVTVWLAVTALAGIGTHLCVTAAASTLAHGQHASPDAAVLLVAAVAGSLICPWVWLVATTTVVDHVRGRTLRTDGVVRRAVLLACGAAVTLTAGPVHAYEASDVPTRSVAHVLDGLPFPDRAGNPVGQPSETVSPDPVPTASSPSPAAMRTGAAPEGSPTVHVVRPGDSLWHIAASHADGRTPAEQHALVTEIHEANRQVIGSDPDLIVPGQELVLPARSGSTTSGSDSRR